MQPAALQHTLLVLVCVVVVSNAAASNLAQETQESHRELKTTYSDCVSPPNGLSVWFRGPYEKVRGCWESKTGGQPRVMLNSYRSGGEMNVHWKYWEEGDESQCLKDWTYYGKDGTTLIAKIQGYTTTIGDKKPWCALPVLQGGKQGYQFDNCICKEHKKICIKPANSPAMWRYGSGTFRNCTSKKEPNGDWAMLNAYQSGGKEDIHWMFADRYTDMLCVKKWTYYAKDGVTVIAEIDNYNTTIGESKPWCMVPEYRANGVQGKQCDFCTCHET